MATLLALAPALPSGEASKYVAAAYLVFLVLILVYVAIMAAKLQRIERELRELADHAEEPGAAAAATRRRPPAAPPRPRTATPRSRRWPRRCATDGGTPAGGRLDVRAARPRRLAQDRAAGAARAPGADRGAGGRRARRAHLLRAGARGGGDLDLQPDRALPGRLRPGRGGVGGARRALPPGRDQADRAARPPLLAACGRGDPPPLPGHRRPRLDDHRRGRDPGAGEARLRAGAGRGGDRADPQPPLPRGADRRRPGPRGDRGEREGPLDLLGRGRARPAHPRRPRRPPGTRDRSRRDLGAGRAGPGRPRRRHRLHRQPPLRPRDRPRPALRRRGGALRRASGAARGRRHRRLGDQLPPPHPRARRPRAGDGGARRAAPAAGRHRRAPRRRSLLPRDRRGQPPRRRRRAADRRAQRQRPRGGGEAGGEHPRCRAEALRALARLARGGADDRLPARARGRGRAQGPGRERVSAGRG